MRFYSLIAFAGLSIVVLSSLNSCVSSNYETIESIENLGEKLFNDESLSRDGNQSCASCHDSQRAFTDSRKNLTSHAASLPGAVSTGQDDQALGDINTPSAMYASFVPAFHFDKTEGLYKGGLFYNGRATNLIEQAKQPFVNPAEMQTTPEAVVAKVQEKYREAFQSLFGGDIFNNTDDAFNAVATAIAAFESTKTFAPFDSKFDRVLKGEATFTAEEKKGFDLFFAENKGNCAACHPVPTLESTKIESVFTDFSYDNLGTPKNILVRTHNGKTTDYVDNGLFDHPEVNDESLKGAFRVPTLRNVSVTAPYMHNGVFKELATVIHFYNTRDVAGSINPETGQAWQAAEIDITKNTDELGDLGLTAEEVDAIVVFLNTLTDRQFEHLLP